MQVEVNNAEKFHLATSEAGETVSVIVPCYNEERFIGKALRNLALQYDNDRYEIVVIDGGSTDRTLQVIDEFISAHPQLSVKVLNNPARAIPISLNLGITAARGEIIARMDAHAVPSTGYIRNCVATLNQNSNGVVGAPCNVLPPDDTLMARAIAFGVSSRFGIGDAKYRLKEGKRKQESVDTVAFACFRRELWQELGGFDERLLTNEDYDFNYRVRKRGGTVLLDRGEHCDYFSRATLGDLAPQYFRYGQWKARMLRQHPSSVRLRHLVAPLFVLSIVLLSLSGFFWPWAWAILGIELLLYLLAALKFAWKAKQQLAAGLSGLLVMPLVFVTIHVSWGTSFWIGLFSSFSRVKSR